MPLVSRGAVIDAQFARPETVAWCSTMRDQGKEAQREEN